MRPRKAKQMGPDLFSAPQKQSGSQPLFGAEAFAKAKAIDSAKAAELSAKKAKEAAKLAQLQAQLDARKPAAITPEETSLRSRLFELNCKLNALGELRRAERDYHGYETRFYGWVMTQVARVSGERNKLERQLLPAETRQYPSLLAKNATEFLPQLKTLLNYPNLRTTDRQSIDDFVTRFEKGEVREDEIRDIYHIIERTGLREEIRKTIEFLKTSSFAKEREIHIKYYEEWLRRG